MAKTNDKRFAALESLVAKGRDITLWKKPLDLRAIKRSMSLLLLLLFYKCYSPSIYLELFSIADRFSVGKLTYQTMLDDDNDVKRDDIADQKSAEMAFRASCAL